MAMQNVISGVTNVVVGAILVGTIGIVGVGYLTNTTLLTNNGITGTNATVFGVIAIMAIISLFLQFVPRNK